MFKTCPQSYCVAMVLFLLSLYSCQEREMGLEKNAFKITFEETAKNQPSFFGTWDTMVCLSARRFGGS